MIYDRPYMQEPNPGSGGRSRRWRLDQIILAVTIGVFILQAILQAWFDNQLLVQLFALSPAGLQNGFAWTFLSYAFLHEPTLIFHIFFNMVIFYFFAPPLVERMGERWFAVLYFSSVFLGGFAWFMFNLTSQAPLLGASAGVTGMIICYICLHSRQPLYFFFIPIPIKPVIVAAVLVGSSLFLFLLYELPGNSRVAHSAHLGGALAGWLFYRLVFPHKPLFGRGTPSVEAPGWLRKKKATKINPPHFEVNLSNRKQVQSEVDRILDKINDRGFGSLTDEEKKILDRARDQLKK